MSRWTPPRISQSYLLRFLTVLESDVFAKVVLMIQSILVLIAYLQSHSAQNRLARTLAIDQLRTQCEGASLGALLGTLIVFGLGYNVGEGGGNLVYEHGAARVHVANGGVAGGLVAGDEAPGEDSDSH